MDDILATLSASASLYLPVVTFLLVILAVGGKTWAGNKPKEQQGVFEWVKWLWNNITLWGKFVIFVAAIGLVLSVANEVETKKTAGELKTTINSTLDTAKVLRENMAHIVKGLPNLITTIKDEVGTVKTSVDSVKMMSRMKWAL